MFLRTPPQYSFKEYEKVLTLDVDYGILRQAAAVLGDEQPLNESPLLSKGWYVIGQEESLQAPKPPLSTIV